MLLSPDVRSIQDGSGHLPGSSLPVLFLFRNSLSRRLTVVEKMYSRCFSLTLNVISLDQNRELVEGLPPLRPQFLSTNICCADFGAGKRFLLLSFCPPLAVFFWPPEGSSLPSEHVVCVRSYTEGLVWSIWYCPSTSFIYVCACISTYVYIHTHTCVYIHIHTSL